MITLREFRLGDEPALRAVFESAIHEVAIRDYTQAQVDAWAPREVDPALWASRMRRLSPFVAELDGEIVAYADLQPSGYIDHFFVSAAAGRQGVGGQLMLCLNEQAVKRGVAELTSLVSLTAEPFFAHFGFEVFERHVVKLRGAELRNAMMRKTLR
ncbi:MAG: GNAT family N-acetyltransferase [Burkholderiaceae bacterium]